MQEKLTNVSSRISDFFDSEEFLQVKVEKLTNSSGSLHFFLYVFLCVDVRRPKIKTPSGKHNSEKPKVL